MTAAEQLAGEIRKTISRSGCTYGEVLTVLEELRRSYKNSAFNRIVKTPAELAKSKESAADQG